MLSILHIALALVSTASAGPCDALIKKADTVKGGDVASAYGALIKCDRKLAEDNFVRFMTSAGDAQSLVTLSLTAIDADIWSPVWSMVGKISDYSARDEVASEVGGACATHPQVVKFLQGAYFGLRESDFGQWDDAFESCESAELITWMTQQVENPPDKQFDEKFNTVVEVYAKRQGAGALPSLTKGAIKASKAGPFDTMITAMESSVAPSLGEDMTPESRAALESSYVAVAQKVGPDKARAVADRLANSGSEAAAAKLLPAVYPDRVQGGGGFIYGGAALEAADCKGTKTLVIHYASVSEPGKQWNILAAAEAPLRAMKPKLDKCKPESGDPWPTAVTPEPVKDTKAIEAWAGTLQKQWQDKGYTVTLKEEKAVAL